MAQNDAKARDLIASAEGIRVRMFREARAHLLNEKRAEVRPRDISLGDARLVCMKPILPSSIGRCHMPHRPKAAPFGCALRSTRIPR